jgi:hypothetical protein
MSETMMIPWYATGFRHDQFAKDLDEIAEISMHYGATSYRVYRSRDDRYKFQQYVTFADHEDWERYWEGADMVEFRSLHSSWYQVPVLYSPWDLTTSGSLGENGDSGSALPPNGAPALEAPVPTSANGERVRAV